ncbi:MAG: CBS and ACT domain-containing protein [Anaerolineae bacterium]|nr:CBS and ACT domain-containing protein [Anaerolineae bacterium]MDW8101586.1 CBS and ACT domain-containing protein [Anaerolineae bacterium]
MLVKERMNKPVITIGPETSIQDALRIMRENRIRRLPVVEGKKLVGIVTERDLLYASPSPATTLSIQEMHYMLSKLKVREIMRSPVITIDENAPIEEAARLMADNKIGGLPVTRGGELVGIITESDIFKVFTEMMAAREEGLRITLMVPERKGVLASITKAIAARGGNIVSLGQFWGEDLTTRTVTIKVSGISKEALEEAVSQEGIKVLDIR